MNFTILTIVGVAVLVVVLTTIWILSRYRRCPNDQILVVFGKAGSKKQTNEKGEGGFKPKIITSGGTFVWPVIQDFRMMSLLPHEIQPRITGLSSQNIKVTIPVTLITGIGKTQTLMENAASRFLNASAQDINHLIEDTLIGEIRAIMATMSIEEINADRNKFLENAKEKIELELNKLGFTILNINIADIDDDANYIVNLGKKAATQAQAQAEADIAEQKKQGKIKIAITQKEEAIQVAEAEREQQSTVAKTVQEREVAVAQAKKEQSIQLAQAEKERAEGVANATAEQTIAVATAEQKADSAKAEQESIATVNVAKAQAEASAKAAEAEQLKETRIAEAEQLKETKIAEATQKKQASVAEYESDRRQKAAEANKKAGVAEQMATIDVAKAKAEAGKAEADAERVTGTAKVEARMAVAKTEQEQQVKVNEMKAKAQEAELQATMIVRAEKEKEQATIQAEQTKAVATLEAEAQAARILKEAEAQAEAIRKKKMAEADGERSILLAQAEGKRASLMAEAEQAQQIALAPALAFEKMVETAGGNPDVVVQYVMSDKWQDIVGAQVKALEHIQLGNVTVYGDKNTGADFANSFIKNFAPAMDMVNNGLKDKVKTLFAGNKPAAIETADVVEDTTEKPAKGKGKGFKKDPEFEEVK